MNRPRRSLELRLLLPILLAGIAVWGFMEIAEEVLDGDAHAVDAWILSLLRVGPQTSRQPIGPLWFQEAMRDVTALGSPAVLALVVAAAWGGLMMARQAAMAWLALASAGAGLMMTMVLKQVFSRARPQEIYHATVATGYSFPSGHAMMSAVVFLTLAVLAARLAPRTLMRVYLVALAGLLAGLVGLSRIYLGVHWASDVAAGWAAGSAWALACWFVADRLGVGREESR